MGLDVVEVVMAIEREFDIELANEALAQVATVGELEALVARATGAIEPVSRQQFHERLLDIITRETAVERHRLVPYARLYQDLGLD